MAQRCLHVFAAALALACALGPVTAAGPTTSPSSGSEPGLTDVVKVLGGLGGQIEALDASVNAKAANAGKVNAKDVAAFSSQQDAIVAKAAAQLKAVQGLSPEVRARVMAQFNRSAAELVSRTRASWAKLAAGNVSAARWFKDAAADNKMVQLMSAWQKDNQALLQELTSNFTSGKLSAASRAAFVARVDANTKKLKAGVAAIKGISQEERTVAVKAVDTYSVKFRAQLQDAIASLLGASGAAALAKPAAPKAAAPKQKPRRLQF